MWQCGIKPGSPALGARSLSHWTTRKVPKINNLNIIRTFSKTIMVRLIDDSTYTFAFGVIPKYHFIGLNGYLPPEILNSLASLNILTLEFMNLSSKYVVELFMFLGYFTCKGIKIYQLMKIGHSPIFSKTITFSLYKLLPVFP